MKECTDISVIGCDFFYNAGTQVGILQIGCQEYGVNIRSNYPVGLRHLKLVFKICNSPQASHNHIRAALMDKINQKAVKMCIRDRYFQEAIRGEAIFAMGSTVRIAMTVRIFFVA